MTEAQQRIAAIGVAGWIWLGLTVAVALGVLSGSRFLSFNVLPFVGVAAALTTVVLVRSEAPKAPVADAVGAVLIASLMTSGVWLVSHIVLFFAALAHF